MIFQIPSLLPPSDLDTVVTTLHQASFVDGQLTAGWHAKQVKQNRQIDRADPNAARLEQLVIEALQRNPLFQSAVRPQRLHSLVFSRYDVGMAYGRHVDNALMGGDACWRADVSFTLFLSDPSQYDGGELVIEAADDEQAYRLPAGSVLVYPSTRLHRVNSVTRGTRFAAAGWVQSLVRNAEEREILFDLDTARRSLFARDGKTNEFDLLSKTLSNLLRKWAN